MEKKGGRSSFLLLDADGLWAVGVAERRLADAWKTPTKTLEEREKMECQEE